MATTHTIEVDEQVFAELQLRAEPLVDDANSVLRRLLGLGSADAVAPSAGEGPTRAGQRPATRSSRADKVQAHRSPARTGAPPPRAPRGSLLPQAEFELPILEALVDLGGSAPSSRVIELTGKKLESKLGSDDRVNLRAGESRWQNRARFARLQLKRLGQIATDSPHGIWEITDAGRARVAAKR